MNLRILTSLILIMSLSLQAQELRVIADTMKKESGLKKLFRKKKVFSYPKRKISSLDGLDQIPGIEDVEEVNLPGNNIRVLTAGFFTKPKFKKIRWLNVSHNKIKTLERGTLEGLDNLEILILDGNLLTSIQPGALKGPKNLKELWLYGNPGATALVEQARKELPGTKIVDQKPTKKDMERTLKIVGAVGVVLVATAAAIGVGVALANRGKTGTTEPATVYGPKTLEAAQTIEIQELLSKSGIADPKEIKDITEEILSHPDFSFDAQVLVLTKGQTLNEALQGTPIADAKPLFDLLAKEHNKSIFYGPYARNIKAFFPFFTNRLAIEAFLFDTPEGDRATMVQRILQVVARVNQENPSSIIPWLVSRGANVNAPNSEGNTPLYEAALRGNVEAVDALKAAGANVDAVTRHDGGYQLFLSAIRDNNEKVIKALVAAGANVNAHDQWNPEPLLYLAVSSDVKVIKALIEAGANVNAPNSEGKTPLYEAELHGHVEAAAALKAAGANDGTMIKKQ